MLFLRKNLRIYGLLVIKYDTLCEDNLNYENRFGLVCLGGPVPTNDKQTLLPSQF